MALPVNMYVVEAHAQVAINAARDGVAYLNQIRSSFVENLTYQDLKGSGPAAS